MKKYIFSLLILISGNAAFAQQTKESFDRGLQVMQERGDIRREGNHIIFLKQNPGDTAFYRYMYNQMLSGLENPYTISFEIDPKYIKANSQHPVQVPHNIPAQQQTVQIQQELPQAVTNLRIRTGRYIIQLENGPVLELPPATFKNNAASVTQIQSMNYTLNQLWDISAIDRGRYVLFNVGSGKKLGIAAGVNAPNGTPVLALLPPGTNTDATSWVFQSAGDGKYTIHNCATGRSDKVLDVTGGAITTYRTHLQLWDKNNNANQVWLLTPSSDSAYVTGNTVDLRRNQTYMKKQDIGIERGYCTYFGNIAALEAAYKKRGYGAVDLSEEYFSIMAKVMYLEPYWSRITSSNRRENQMAATQGGGSIFWYTAGLRIPLESDVPYRASYTTTLDYSTVNQRYVNDYNATQMTAGAIKANTYYGATAGVNLTEAEFNDFAAYKKLLDLGYEIDISLNGGEHNVVVIGYDKSDPANPKLWIKDSYDREPGRECIYSDDRRTFADVIGSHIRDASYITAVSEPAPFPELAFMGRWNLDFDGHRGMLDIRHIPGINYVREGTHTTEGGPLITTDNRIGDFYDEAGNSFRVNGKITGNKIEFYFDLSDPNQQWDVLHGRKFEYYINPGSDIMSGKHTDADGSVLGGYAIKAPYITHASSVNSFSRFLHTDWRIQWSGRTGTMRFEPGEDETTVQGNFNDGTGSEHIAISRNSSNPNLLNVRLGSETGTARYMNHETGMICGNTDGGKVLLMWKE